VTATYALSLTTAQTRVRHDARLYRLSGSGGGGGSLSPKIAKSPVLYNGSTWEVYISHSEGISTLVLKVKLTYSRGLSAGMRRNPDG